MPGQNSVPSRSCLTDMPLSNIKYDTLEAGDYARALSEFIINATTPVTIGIQGGWGSGKTSLITLIQSELESAPGHPALCIQVNAWEHSLFQAANSKAEVALSLLDGLARGLHDKIRDTGWIDENIKKKAGVANETLSRVMRNLKGAVAWSAKVGVQMALNMITRTNVTAAANQLDSESGDSQPSHLARNVHELKGALATLAADCTNSGEPAKIVFFIDDLDRVAPPIAVEILDIVKNIFDIPNCVFVLAIDYEVVALGLHDKFGQETSENEREFRQYFDKIIQIPFTMPVGAYGDHLGELLKAALAQLGINVNRMNPFLFAHMAEDGRLATGGNPRSIKRIINTLSLLQHIKKARAHKRGRHHEAGIIENLEAVFIVVALHINFPEIFARLMERPDFMNWRISDLDLAWKLDSEDNTSQLQALGEDEFFDDDWEKVVYCLCAKSSWLQAHSRHVSQLLNRLAIVLDKSMNPDPKHLTTEGLETLEDILDSTRIVTVNAATSIRNLDTDNLKDDAITRFCRLLHKKLSIAIGSGNLPYDPNLYATRNELGQRLYIAPMEGEIRTFHITWLSAENELILGFQADSYGLPQEKAAAIIEKMGGKFSCSNECSQMNLHFETPFTRDDFQKRDGERLVKKLAGIYNTIREAQIAMRESAF